MNGLTYIRIRCNVSQSFLAQKLGVTRQAINLWENRTTPPPGKRLKQLTEFFGIDEKYFGEISEEQQHEIDAIPAYRHEENGHTYYCNSICQGVFHQRIHSSLAFLAPHRKRGGRKIEVLSWLLWENVWKVKYRTPRR